MAEGRAFVRVDSPNGLVEVSIYVQDNREGAEVNETNLDTILGNVAQVAVDKSVTVAEPAAVESAPETPAIAAAPAEADEPAQDRQS